MEKTKSLDSTGVRDPAVQPAENLLNDYDILYALDLIVSNSCCSCCAGTKPGCESVNNRYCKLHHALYLAAISLIRCALSSSIGVRSFYAKPVLN